MAYAAAVSRTDLVIDGNRYTIVEVNETGEVAAASEWGLVGLPEICTITHFEAELVNDGTGGPGSTSIDPSLGNVASFALATLAASLENDQAAQDVTSYVKNEIGGRVTTPTRTLYGRSKPSGTLGATGQIKTRITIRWGHH